MAHSANIGMTAYKSHCDKGQKDTHVNSMIGYIKQKDHDVFLLTTEVKDLKYKLKNAEAKETELNKRLCQLTTTSSNLQHQLQQLKNQLESMHTLAADKKSSLPPIKPVFSEDTKNKSDNRSSTLNIEVIEQVCKSVISPFTEIAKCYRDADIQCVKDRVTMFLTAELM